jgi:hypothetical protein
MAVLPNPPIVAATGPGDLRIARTIAAHTDLARVSRRESVRWVGVDSLPFLNATEAGKRFLAAAAPRALARGMPKEACPVSAMASGAPSAARADIAVQALRNCLATLAPEHSDCGCRIVALDDMVTVPRKDTAYATGTSARLRVASLGIDLLLVAEQTAPDGMLLRDLRGPVARLKHGEADAVTVEFLGSGRRFEGRRIAVGFRRGRIAERIYATDSDGNRLSLLVGFEPDELAARAAAWLAWPSEG